MYIYVCRAFHVPFDIKGLDISLLPFVGEENRAIRETHMNQSSSRSHSIFQLVIEQELSSTDERLMTLRQQYNASEDMLKDCILRSKLNLVDLAGEDILILLLFVRKQEVR